MNKQTTQNEGGHTPLPWSTSSIQTGSGVQWDICTPDGGDMIADLANTNNQGANAQFIVRACNAFDDLVAALEAARRELAYEACNNALQQVENALAKAKPQP